MPALTSEGYVMNPEEMQSLRERAETMLRSAVEAWTSGDRSAACAGQAPACTNCIVPLYSCSPPGVCREHGTQNFDCILGGA